MLKMSKVLDTIFCTLVDQRIKKYDKFLKK